MIGQRMSRALLGAACALLVSGCANMAVRVEILNSAYWASPEYVESVTLATITDAEQAIRDGRFGKRREELKRAVRRALADMSELKIQPRSKACVNSRDIDKSLLPAFNATIDRQFQEARSAFHSAFVALQAASPARAKTLYVKGNDALVALVAQLEQQVRSTLSPFCPTPPLEAEEALTTLEQATQRITEGLIGGGDILDDPRAAAVVYAPNHHWTGQYNQTLCSGSFGNTDCAVKMEGLGTFTIKGVRLDAAQITQATFSATRDLIQAAAAVYGVPVPRAPAATTTEGATATPATTTTEIDSPVRRQREATTALLQLSMARVAMLQAIVSQRSAFADNASAASRAAAIQIIKSIVEANRKQLDPSQTP